MSEQTIAPSTLRVRPYMLTMGRTTAAVNLEIETIVRAVGVTDGRPAIVIDPARARRLGPETRRIIELCHRPLSVAELSAHLRLPLQVIKVLVGDLVADGLVTTHSQTAEVAGRPDLVLLERVLEGLQRL